MSDAGLVITQDVFGKQLVVKRAWSQKNVGDWLFAEVAPDITTFLLERCEKPELGDLELFKQHDVLIPVQIKNTTITLSSRKPFTGEEIFDHHLHPTAYAASRLAFSKLSKCVQVSMLMVVQ
jgi:hypothetical protein